MRIVPLTRTKLVGTWTRPRRWSKKCRENWRVRFGGREWQLVTDPIHGTWYTGYWEGFTFYPSWEHWPGYRGLTMIPKKKVQALAAEVDHLASLDTANFKKMACLVAHCAATRYLDGSPRIPGQIVITTQGEMWIVDVRDKDTAKRIKASGPTLDAALTLANALAGSEDAPWEHASWLEQEPPKKSARRR